ncbi:DUF6893 family small protein [Flexivirga alba]|uniref:DUF6893 family small protein n=1 Tax=Flexivirga alba TaxID=702742 RepID=A0ABW2ALE1_9MICO
MMMRKIVLAVVGAMVCAGAVAALPDVRRYLRLRSM